MKICFVGSEIAPIKKDVIIGGVANSAIRLAQGLQNINHRIYVVTSRPRIFDDNPNNFSFPIYQLAIRSEYPSVSYGIEFAFKSNIKMKKIDKIEYFDIVHGHSGEPRIALIPAIYGLLFSKPSVYTLYCPIRPGDDRAKYCLLKLSKIVAISENVKKSIIKLNIPSEKIDVIPPAIDITKYNNGVTNTQLRAKLGLKNSDFAILFVGNLMPSKGIDILLDALIILIKKFPDIKLLITLEMPHQNFFSRKKEILSKIKNYRIEKNIIEFGVVNDMPGLISASDTLVAPFIDTYGPSDYPLPVLEAMAVGKPVIATKIGGLPEIIENMKNGILIPPNDVNALVKSLEYLINNRYLQNSLGSNAAALIREKFSIPIVAKQMEAIYEQVSRI